MRRSGCLELSGARLSREITGTTVAVTWLPGSLTRTSDPESIATTPLGETIEP